MPTEATKQSIRCSKATSVGSWISSVLAVLLALRAVEERGALLGAAAMGLAIFAFISWRKAKNDFIHIDDHQLTVSNHPLGRPAPYSITWAAILETQRRFTGLDLVTAKGSTWISLKEFPPGTAKRLLKEIRERAPWANLKK
ncbi:MAG TPA: hypothetical protein VK842_02275 [bacterium]|nr:hypothetical protein [bacterium]